MKYINLGKATYTDKNLFNYLDVVTPTVCQETEQA